MKPSVRSSQRYIVTGIVTVIPIMVTVFVFSFILDLLSDIGRIKVVVLANAVRPLSPDLARWMLEVPWLQSTIAIVLTLLLLYFLGWTASRIVGQRILDTIDAWFKRIPLVTTIYNSTKQIIETFQGKRGDNQRVVLIEFPHRDMKAVGFLTQVLIDERTGIEIAAVYVPTAPNPTGGYLELVPKDRLIYLDWTVDQAMAFIISGGTTAPKTVRFSRDAETEADGKIDPVRSVAGAETADVVGIDPLLRESHSRKPRAASTV